MKTFTPQRSGVAPENYGEVYDAEENKGLSAGKSEQYITPPDFAEKYMAMLPSPTPATIIDPQCGIGNLVSCVNHWSVAKFGIELDNRIDYVQGVNLINANSQKVFEIIADVFPTLRFVCANANPPFGRRWKTADGNQIDSTLSTWRFVTSHACYGFFIAGRSTIEKLEINKHPWVFHYDTIKASELWENMRDTTEIGVVVWKRPDGDFGFTDTSEVHRVWRRIDEILEEEKKGVPPFNIYLDREGKLQTYLSQRGQIKKKLSKIDIAKLQKINDSHPLTLTTEKSTRNLMRELVDAGVYEIQPEALEAIKAALDEVNSMACPIMPVTDFSAVAWADEEDVLTCIKDIDCDGVRLTAGASYPLDTGTFKFTDKFTRDKVHFDEHTKQTYTVKHECENSGTGRYIQISDDNGRVIRFSDRPTEGNDWEKDDSLLWQWFKRPIVKTIADARPEKVEQNNAVMLALEMMAGYEYFKGQREYLARLAAKDSALIAAETGVGKSLIAISLIALKQPHHALVIAPQGTMRSSESEEDEDGETENLASQWIQELSKFAPYLQVWEIFTYADYERILSLNNGELPPGVFVSYYEAMFTNGAREKVPDTWNDEKLNKWCSVNGFGPAGELDGGNSRANCDTVGHEVDGIRCIIEPCLATKIGHHFDMVLADEAHKACNGSALLSQMLIRMQPKYRYALTATPIPDRVSNIFTLMGWLAVPEWYKGDRRNAAWPYAREDYERFNNTFLTHERDVTEEHERRAKDPKWRGKCEKASPIISSPARLLKILNPTMAFISKEECKADYIPPKVMNIQVPMGRDQMRLYAHFLNRANISGHPLVRARKQTAYLRNICADPRGFTHGGPKVTTNFNPKVVAILELVRDILGKGETVVIVNARVGLTDTIQERLAEAGVPIARIDSTISADQQSAQANLFKSGKAKVMCMGLRCAAAHSFNACKNLIIGSLEFSPGCFTQAKGRIDRIVNDCVKNIYVILHSNSIEQIMHETVSVKGDASEICLRGRRVPRTFKPVDMSEVLAAAIDRLDTTGSKPETECEQEWPKLKKLISLSLTKAVTLI